MKEFAGRALRARSLYGEALVSRPLFDVAKGLKENGFIEDPSNADLNAKSLEGKILCFNGFSGLEEGIYSLLDLILKGRGPSAILCKGNIDPLGALLYALLPDDCPLAIVDRLGDEFLGQAKTGIEISIDPSGKATL